MYYSSASHYAFDEVPPLPGLLVERLTPVALVRHGSSNSRRNLIVSGFILQILKKVCNIMYDNFKDLTFFGRDLQETNHVFSAVPVLGEELADAAGAVGAGPVVGHERAARHLKHSGT